MRRGAVVRREVLEVREPVFRSGEEQAYFEIPVEVPPTRQEQRDQEEERLLQKSVEKLERIEAEMSYVANIFENNAAAQQNSEKNRKARQKRKPRTYVDVVAPWY